MYKKRFDFNDTVNLIVGGRGLLGTNFCIAIAELGGKVFSADIISESRASESFDSNKIKQEHNNIHQMNIDVKNEKSVINVVKEIIKKEKKIDNLIFSVNAKAIDHYKPFTETSLEGWQSGIQTEMDGIFLCAKHVGKEMEILKKGNITFISSIYGIVGNDQRIYQGSNLEKLYLTGNGSKGKEKIFAPASYSAVKGAIISYTKFLAAYWGEHGIRVNCVSPGGVSHPGENETFVKKYSYRTPLGRKAEIDEITNAVLYITSDLSTYVTGHNLVVDGGWTIW